ncbi:uncharacterized protein VNE69_09078 [Vairimorpha necatrix]|uniref:Uncharacterized protein n=1 Tax=Vairimorpha necatrix TaxID=6039 RepID=A0AAX4JFB1_9MICR
MIFILGFCVLTALVCSYKKFSKPQVDNQTIEIFEKHTNVNKDDLLDLIKLLDIFKSEIEKLILLLENNDKLNLKNFISSIQKLLKNTNNEDVEYESRFLIYFLSRIGINFINRIPNLKTVCDDIIKSSKQKDFLRKKIQEDVSMCQNEI